MSKWADFAIVEVKYNEEQTHIVAVKRYKDTGDGFEDLKIKTKEVIVDAIKNKGLTYITSKKGSDGKWHKGSSVEIMRVDGVDYLRTDGNKKRWDNLGNLAEFQ